jgi:hypothetical protein
MKGVTLLVWILKLSAAAIMLQTLYFKFTAHPESVALFTQLNLEPWGRIGIGVAELIAAILLLVPRTACLGAVFSMGLMAGAIFFHLTQLGIVFQGSALLFYYAVYVLLASSVILLYHRKDVVQAKDFLLGRFRSS